jgi:hypothetical protein
VSHGEEDFLDCLFCAGAGRRLRVGHVVGVGRDHSYPLRELVGRVSQRLVLNLFPPLRLGVKKLSTQLLGGTVEKMVVESFSARLAR